MFAYRMAVRDGLLYFGSYEWNDGMQIYDAHNPSQLVQISAIDTLRQVSDFILSGDSLYVASGFYGLHIVNVSDPAAPSVVATYRLSNGLHARNIAVDGAKLYVGNEGNGLTIFDFSTPGQITPVSTTDTLCISICERIAASPQRAYVLTTCKAFRILDTSNSSSPLAIGAYTAPDRVYSTALTGNYALVADDNGLSVADVSAPSSPVWIGSYERPTNAYYSWVFTRGQYAYLTRSDQFTDDPDTIIVIDVSDPHQLIEVSQFAEPTGVQAIAFADSLLYAGYYQYDSSGGRVVNVSDPAHPMDLADFEVNDPLSFVVDDTLMFAATYQGLAIYSLTDPIHPVQIGTALDGWFISGVAVSGNFAFVCAGGSLLWVIDISVPTSPSLLTYLPVLDARNIQIIGQCAYIGAYNGIQVFSISNPSNPVQLGYYQDLSENYHAYDMVVRDSLAFLAEYHQLSIYQFTPPTSAPHLPNASMPRELSLSAYPNPFNSTSTFLMDVPPGPKEVTITVFDLLGREVRREVKSVTSAHMIYRFDASALSSGVYFARVATPEVQRTTKLMLLK
jgi:hypothetical protein